MCFDIVGNDLGYDLVATSNCDVSEASRRVKGAVEISQFVLYFKFSNSFRFSPAMNCNHY